MTLDNVWCVLMQSVLWSLLEVCKTTNKHTHTYTHMDTNNLIVGPQGGGWGRLRPLERHQSQHCQRVRERQGGRQGELGVTKKEKKRNSKEKRKELRKSDRNER